MNIRLLKPPPSWNNFRIADPKAEGATIFDANGEPWIECLGNDSGFGNVITFQDNNPSVGYRSFIMNGETANL